MKTLVYLVAVIVIILIILYGIFSQSILIFHLWKWFLVPVFNLPLLTYTQTGGLAFILSLFKTVDFIKEEYKDNSKVGITFILGPWITLIIAYFYYVLLIL